MGIAYARDPNYGVPYSYLNNIHKTGVLCFPYGAKRSPDLRGIPL
jgi:hypothetical protein